MARVGWACTRGAWSQGAINGAFEAYFAPEFGSTRWFLGALEPARAGSCKNAVVHPVRIVEEKAEHVGEREALCDLEKGTRKRVPFAWRMRMCWARLHCVELSFVGVALVVQHMLQLVGQHDVEVVDVEMQRDGVRIKERTAHTAMPSCVASRRLALPAAPCSRRRARAKKTSYYASSGPFFHQRTFRNSCLLTYIYYYLLTYCK